MAELHIRKSSESKSKKQSVPTPSARSRSPDSESSSNGDTIDLTSDDLYADLHSVLTVRKLESSPSPPSTFKKLFDELKKPTVPATSVDKSKGGTLKPLQNPLLKGKKKFYGRKRHNTWQYDGASAEPDKTPFQDDLPPRRACLSEDMEEPQNEFIIYASSAEEDSDDDMSLSPSSSQSSSSVSSRHSSNSVKSSGKRTPPVQEVQASLKLVQKIKSKKAILMEKIARLEQRKKRMKALKKSKQTLKKTIEKPNTIRKGTTKQVLKNVPVSSKGSSPRNKISTTDTSEASTKKKVVAISATLQKTAKKRSRPDASNATSISKKPKISIQLEKSKPTSAANNGNILFIKLQRVYPGVEKSDYCDGDGWDIVAIKEDIDESCNQLGISPDSILLTRDLPKQSKVSAGRKKSPKAKDSESAPTTPSKSDSQFSSAEQKSSTPEKPGEPNTPPNGEILFGVLLQLDGSQVRGTFYDHEKKIWDLPKLRTTIRVYTGQLRKKQQVAKLAKQKAEISKQIKNKSVSIAKRAQRKSSPGISHSLNQKQTNKKPKNEKRKVNLPETMVPIGRVKRKAPRIRETSEVISRRPKDVVRFKRVGPKSKKDPLPQKSLNRKKEKISTESQRFRDAVALIQNIERCKKSSPEPETPPTPAPATPSPSFTSQQPPLHTVPQTMLPAPQIPPQTFLPPQHPFYTPQTQYPFAAQPHAYGFPAQPYYNPYQLPSTAVFSPPPMPATRDMHAPLTPEHQMSSDSDVYNPYDPGMKKHGDSKHRHHHKDRNDSRRKRHKSSSDKDSRRHHRHSEDSSSRKKKKKHSSSSSRHSGSSRHKASYPSPSPPLATGDDIPTTWNPQDDPFLSELERVLDMVAKRKKPRTLEWIREHFNHSQPSVRKLRRVLKTQSSYGLMGKYENFVTYPTTSS